MRRWTVWTRLTGVFILFQKLPQNYFLPSLGLYFCILYFPAHALRALGLLLGGVTKNGTRQFLAVRQFKRLYLVI